MGFESPRAYHFRGLKLYVGNNAVADLDQNGNVIARYADTQNLDELRGQLQLAKDVTQDAFQRVMSYGRFEDLQDPEKFLAYFRAVCRNVARDALKRLAPELASGLSLEDFENLRPRDNVTATPEQILQAQQLREQLLNDLGPGDRNLLTMLMNGRSLDEIALGLGLSYQNAGVRVHRLRQIIRKVMIQKGL